MKMKRTGRSGIINMDIVVSYNSLEDQRIWEAFLDFFRNVKGYSDWTDEEIATSMNSDDISEFCKYITNLLGGEEKC